jgi:hypothetical protein
MVAATDSSVPAIASSGALQHVETGQHQQRGQRQQPHAGVEARGVHEARGRRFALQAGKRQQRHVDQRLGPERRGRGTEQRPPQAVAPAQRGLVAQQRQQRAHQQRPEAEVAQHQAAVFVQQREQQHQQRDPRREFTLSAQLRGETRESQHQQREQRGAEQVCAGEQREPAQLVQAGDQDRVDRAVEQRERSADARVRGLARQQEVEHADVVEDRVAQYRQRRQRAACRDQQEIQVVLVLAP